MKFLFNIKIVGLLIVTSFLMSGCFFMSSGAFKGYRAELDDYELEGHGRDSVLVIPISGMISNMEKDEMIRTKPSMIKEVVSQIQKAKEDYHVKAVVLKVNSRGGTITGSEILYNELKKLKAAKDIPIVTVMMDTATSGGYYISLASDYIIAHRTTLTGSVGVVLIRPKVHGLLDKIGVEIETSQSGKNKDMGSPFRPTTREEEASFQSIIDEMADLFESRLVENRSLSRDALDEVMTAKVFTANQALDLGLIDQIGYIDDALMKAKELAEIDSNARVIMYRRVEFEDDNIYNNITTSSNSMIGSPSIDLGPLASITELKAGLYYIWNGTAQ